jgi:hypothetical protein
VSGRLKLRNGTPEDREAIAALVADSPGLEFPVDLFAWPTIEVAVVEDEEGRVIGMGYIEAIPEGHFVFSRTGTDSETRRNGILLLKHAAEQTLEKLNLPLMRCPGATYLLSMIEWAKEIPGMATDPRVHLTLSRPRRPE